MSSGGFCAITGMTQRIFRSLRLLKGVGCQSPKSQILESVSIGGSKSADICVQELADEREVPVEDVLYDVTRSPHLTKDGEYMTQKALVVLQKAYCRSMDLRGVTQVRQPES